MAKFDDYFTKNPPVFKIGATKESDLPINDIEEVAFIGRSNVGKSSLINALTNQSLSVVSNTPGTTTDPVSKAMELLPLGPVMIIDTAGLDDIGNLGVLRVEKSKEVIDVTDLAVMVFSAEDTDVTQEKIWINILKEKNIPVIGVINKIDIFPSNLEI